MRVAHVQLSGLADSEPSAGLKTLAVRPFSMNDPIPTTARKKEEKEKKEKKFRGIARFYRIRNVP